MNNFTYEPAVRDYIVRWFMWPDGLVELCVSKKWKNVIYEEFFVTNCDFQNLLHEIKQQLYCRRTIPQARKALIKIIEAAALDT